MKVAMVSWNCENMLPGDQPMDVVKNAVMNAQPTADVIAFGMQELGKAGKFRDKLTTAFPGYVNVGDTSLYGMTKPPKLCSTSMFVIAKANAIAQNKVVAQDQIDARNFSRLKKPTKGGGIVVCMLKPLTNAAAFPVAFISCHLDASGVSERVGHVNQILGATSIHDSPRKKGFFLMGDLNYRLGSTYLTYEQIASQILTPDGRAQLALRDSFKPTDFPNFTFPPILRSQRQGEVTWSLPTYKRSYKKTCKLSVAAIQSQGYPNVPEYTYSQNPCMTLDQLGALTLPNRFNIELCIRCYFEKAIKKANEKKKKTGGFQKTGLVAPSKKGQVTVTTKTPVVDDLVITQYETVAPYELGWLDRIGYRVQNGATINNFKVSAIPNVFLSDHMPVLATCDLT